MMTLLLAVVLVAGQDPAVQREAEFARDVVRAVQSERLAWQTGRIEWSGWTAREGLTWSGTRYHTTRFAGDDQLLIEKGDADGVMGRRSDGSEWRDLYYRLYCDGRQWQRYDSSTQAEVRLTQPDMVNVRALGLYTDVPRDASINNLELGTLSPDQELTAVRRDDGMIELSRWGRGRLSRFKWVIDPDRNWNPVEASHEVGDEVRSRSRSELAEFNGVWFVRRCEYYDAEHADGKEPLYVMEVSEAEFNHPDHPRRFSPADIGLEEGMAVSAYADAQATFEDKPIQMGWHDGKLISRAELREGILNGTIKRSAGMNALVDRALARGTPRDSVESSWRSYTRRFIVRFDLDEDQSQKAMSILSDCEGRASAYFAAHDDEFDEIAASLAALEQDQSMSGAEKSEKLKQLRERRIELERPIRKIASTRLYPGLDKLPTRAQRKAAERLDALTGKKGSEPETEEP